MRYRDTYHKCRDLQDAVVSVMLVATGTVSSPQDCPDPVVRNHELLLAFWRTVNLVHAFAYEHATDYSGMYEQA